MDALKNKIKLQMLFSYNIDSINFAHFDEMYKIIGTKNWFFQGKKLIQKWRKLGLNWF